MTIDVYAFGSALMDIQLNVHDAVLDAIKVEKGNMYLTNRERQEEFLKQLLGGEFGDLGAIETKTNTAAGGSAANTAFGITQLGGKAGLCGKVANDTFGTIYIEDMKKCGVYFNEKRVEGMTGTCIILISEDAQRTMLTCLAVSSEIAEEDIDEKLLKNSKHLYLEGYLFDSDVATHTILKAIDIAKNNNVGVALSASDPFCVERHKEQFLQLIMDDVDLLFANAEEAKALTGSEDLEKAIKTLGRWCKHVAVTDGANGSTLCFNRELLKIAPFPVTPLDTTGAGDSYAAGLLFGLTHGFSLETSGRIASFFSSRVVSKMGPRYSGNIQTKLKEHALHEP
jgi:sugar/nucleoside kinase (ribokinase family)